MGERDTMVDLAEFVDGAIRDTEKYIAGHPGFSDYYVGRLKALREVEERIGVDHARGPHPLAQRLRDVAGRIAFDECGKWFNPPRFGPTQKQVGTVIATALLRELAAAEKTFGVGTLLDLADSIEKGAE